MALVRSAMSQNAAHRAVAETRKSPERLNNHSPDQEQALATGNQSSITHAQIPPDGGFQAWLQVLGSFVLFFNTWGLINIFGVFQTYYELNTGWSQSASDILWIGSLQASLLFFSGFFTGPVFDMGYLNALLGTGMFMVTFGLMMTSICRTYWQTFLAQGLCVGLGMGCSFLPSVTIIAQYFSNRKAIAFGIAATGSAVGGIVYEIIFRQLQPRIGFGWALRTISFIVLATMMVPLFSMRQRHQAQKVSRRVFTLAVFKYMPFTVYCIGLFFAFTAVYVTFFYIQLFALEKTDTDPELASYLLAIVIGSSTLGRLIPNYLADHLGPLNVQIPLALGCSILCFCCIAVFKQAGIIAFAVFYGLCSGGFNSLPGVTVISLSRDLTTIGIQVGISLTVAGLGVLIGEPIAGAILRSASGWVGLQIFCGCLFIVAAFLMSVARLMKTGFGWFLKA